MLRKSLFALSSILVLGSVAACGDDEPGDNPPKGGVSCEEDPMQDHCEVPVDHTNAREGMVYSYVSGLKLPGAGEDEAGEGVGCCYDYDGDGEYDNALGTILPLVGSLAPGLDIDELLAGVFEDGTLSLIFQHEKFPTSVDLPGTFDMSLFLSASESTWEDRLNHKGVFTLEGEALTTVKNAQNRRGNIEAKAEKLPIELDLTAFGDGVTDIIPSGKLTLPLNVVRLNLTGVKEADGEGQAGIYNATPATEGGVDVVLVTEDKGKAANFLSGGLHGGEIASLANDIIGDMCDLSVDLLSFDASVGEPGEEDELRAPIFEINDDAVAELQASTDETCGTIAGFASSLGILGALFDVDSTGNGVADSLSLGFNLQVSGAVVAGE